MPSEPPALRDARTSRAPFLERLDAIAELERLAAGGRRGRGWVVVTGAPGTGKSALAAELAKRLSAAGRHVAHHAIGAGTGSADRPEVIARALAAQIEAILPREQRSIADAPSGLTELCSRVSSELLAPRGEQLVIIVDGIDEVEGDDAGRSPLSRFLPPALPPSVLVIATSTPDCPHLAWIEERDGVRGIALDGPRFSASAEQACRAVVVERAAALGLAVDPALAAHIVERARGNLLFVHTVLQWLHLDPKGPRRAPLPEGLDALCHDLTEALFGAEAPAAPQTFLGLLATAREPLPMEVIHELIPRDILPSWDALPAAARLLCQRPSDDPRAPIGLRHPRFRALVRAAIGPEALSLHHRRIAHTLAAWPPPDRRDLERRRYGLRHAISHALEAGEIPRVERLASDLDYLEVKCREEGPAAVQGDLRRAIPQLSSEAFVLRISALYRAISAEEHNLRARPDALPGLVYNRLRASGMSQRRIESELCFPRGLPAPRLRHPVRLDQAVELTLAGHSAEVTACAISADGRRVLSASADKTLRLWDIQSGQLLATLTGHTEEVTACALSPDGKLAASAAADRTLRLWDLASRACVASLRRRSERANACTITADGLVVCAGDSDVIEVLDIASGRWIKRISGYAEEISARSLSPDGSLVCSSSYENRVEIWRLDTGLIRALLIGHTAPVNACALSPDGKLAVTASHDGTLRVFRFPGGELTHILAGHRAAVLACALSPDGSQLLSASADHRLKLWDLATGQEIDTLSGHTEPVSACAISPDGKLGVSASADHTLKVWSLADNQARRADHGGEILACAVDPPGSRVVSASADKTLKIWDAQTGEVLSTLHGHTAGVNACAVFPDGKRVISASYDRTLKVWDLASGALLSTLHGHGAGVNACAVTRDGKRAVSASYDKTLIVWDLASGKALHTLSGHTDFVNACAVTPDGSRVLSASADKTLRLWDLDSGKMLRVLEGHEAGVNACAITPGGRWAVSASYDKRLRVWDLPAGKTVRLLAGHTEAVTACAISPDGETLVSVSYDGTIQVWEIETGERWAETLGLFPFRSVALAEGLIAAGDAQGNLWMLDLPDRADLVPASQGRPSLPSSGGLVR
ncbi:MAG: AAA family ATPase [Byssovorax sp.]